MVTQGRTKLWSGGLAWSLGDGVVEGCLRRPGKAPVCLEHGVTEGVCLGQAEGCPGQLQACWAALPRQLLGGACLWQWGWGSS